MVLMKRKVLEGSRWTKDMQYEAAEDWAGFGKDVSGLWCLGGQDQVR